jgi:hypothetical protein
MKNFIKINRVFIGTILIAFSLILATILPIFYENKTNLQIAIMFLGELSVIVLLLCIGVDLVEY